ncbi:YopX family protein [Enterococcus gallinarum]|uniref:YopX family protein n=1 Tax=Enterococcus gallinarum TaxID=1353 RepID=UPI00288F50A4|nr:YopX family protein [Enterococcus gallinarum]MDT2695010.1 YopX family protein [Enterococcus gallinarum]
MVPKFRAWDKENDRMIYPSTEGVCFELDDDGINILNVSGDYPEDHVFPAIDSVLMQSTGLKGYMSDSHEDDEEKDVYRGDIIDIFWEEWPMGYYQENHMIGVVDKDETGTAWIIKDAKYDFDTPKPIPSEIDGVSVSMSLPDAEDLEEIFLHNFNLTSSDITILGNIYENPELLEQANES